MNVTISDVMTKPAMTVTKSQTAGHIAELMREHHVSALPVVGPDREPLGIITASDLLDHVADATPASALMSKPPLTIPLHDGPHVAARIMRNHHCHHVVVVDQHQVVGIVSAFDLLELVEEHRYVAREAPTPARRAARRQ